MEVLIIAACIGLIPAFIARKKGHNFIAWWIFGSIIFILALPISIFMKPKDNNCAIDQPAENKKIINTELLKHEYHIPGWVSILVIILAAFAFIYYEGHYGNNGASDTPSPSEELHKLREATRQKIELKYDWAKGGFDNVMFINATIKNNNIFDVKDITLECEHFAKSGTRIGSSTQTIYEIFPAGKKKTINHFNMGLIHTQAAGSSCEIIDFITP
jgi:hypothetical protein